MSVLLKIWVATQTWTTKALTMGREEPAKNSKTAGRPIINEYPEELEESVQLECIKDNITDHVEQLMEEFDWLGYSHLLRGH